MNPTTPTPDATMRAIERHLADNPGNEPLNALGMTVDGRIVRLAEQGEPQRPALQQALEQQLGALMPAGPDGTLRDRMVGTPDAACQTLGHVLDRVRRDRQIRQRLEDLKVQYGAEFATMNERTQTMDMDGQTKTGGEGWREEDGEEWGYHFRNEFTPTHWTFLNNGKRGKTIARDFYMSNVIAHQFEWTFQRNGWLLELPATIERHQIVNHWTLEVLLRHHSDYHCDAFRKDFLETTVNGKSTVRVARDLGLTIDHLTVTYYDKSVDRMDTATYNPGDTPFSVIVYVSPDPAVYGTP